MPGFARLGNILTIALAVALGWLTATARAAEAPFLLVENFTRPLPASEEVQTQVVTENARQGLAMAKLDYRLHPQQRQARLWADRAIPANGQLRLWVKGDKSAGHELQLIIWHAKVSSDERGNPRYDDRREEALERIPLDFDDWRDLAFTIKNVPENHKIWLKGIIIHGRDDKSAATGTLWLDDLRVVPATGKPQVTLLQGLIGPSARNFGNDVQLFCDLADFTGKGGKAQLRVSMIDRNENPVAERDFSLELKPGQRLETALDLKPENLSHYLPPFRISGDLLSTDLPAAAGTFDLTLVMANARSLWEEFSDVHGHWLAAGWESVEGFTEQRQRQWVDWLMGEGPRATAVAQINARLSRVELPAPKPGETAPPGRFALQLDYTDNAEVYNARPRIPRQPANPHSGDRFLPGNAFRAGFWIHGDGSGALVQAVFLDYSDMADFWSGGWKRTNDGTRDLCRLDFTGWRYLEVDLPGNGVGSNERRGSSHGIDFPLELTALRVVSWRNEQERKAAGERRFAGSVQFGPIFAITQQTTTEALVAHLAYDDPNHLYDPKLGAWLTVQNADLATARTVGINWTLLDRQNDVAAKGTDEAALEPGQAHTARIDLAAAAAQIKGRAGPFRLQLSAFDKQDAAVSAVREIVLAAPESNALIADFEADRPFYAFGQGATPAARTSTEQAKTGQRSLAIDWDQKEQHRVVVAIDPPLPGPATEVSLWVFGDQSGALLYPIFGDQRGVANGMEPRQYDLLGGRTTGPLQNAVRVDWNGWRELRFRLPLVPTTWEQSMPVWGFLPSYPLGLQLVLEAPAAGKDKGRLYVDEIRAETHLLPTERLALNVEHDGTTNLLPVNGQWRMLVDNFEKLTPRSPALRLTIADWRGQQVARFEQDLTLTPGQRLCVPFRPELGPGAYTLLVELREKDKVVCDFRQTFVVADLQPVLGADWREALLNPWRLRQPLQSLYTFIDEDWDWIEHFPGNLQTQSVRERAREVRKLGGEPWMLLGYSAYYAAGAGFEDFKAKTFNRRQRDIGHAVDIFLVPERLEDWDNYVCEMMRGAGDDVTGWVLWNNPDARSGSLAVKPERFAAMLAAADKWRQVYCPKRPLLIGGMTPETAIPYLEELAKANALQHLSGINLRLDVGVRSPEDAHVPQTLARVRQALKTEAGPSKQILLTDLDWAVERRAAGLGEFDQAAYLIRSALLLAPLGITPEVAISNTDFARLGVGLTYKDTIALPPNRVVLPELRLKAGWLGLMRTREWLRKLTFVATLEVQDVAPGRTQALLFHQADGKAAVFLWRNNDPGFVSFAHTGLTVARAEDLLGTPTVAKDGAYAVGKLPVLFLLESGSEPEAQALARIWVRTAEKYAWPQQVLAAFTPAAAAGRDYVATANTAATLTGRDADGESLSVPAMTFSAKGSEAFTVPVEPGSELILRKRFLLDATGQEAEVWVNGKNVGLWDLRRSDAQLSGGFREALFVVAKENLGDAKKAAVEIRYHTAANTLGWWAFAGQGGSYPLTAVGALHIDQAVDQPRAARNMAGEPLKIGDESFAEGLGVFAPSLRELALNGQFRRFRAKVGVDAATEGRGSVTFEAYADGKKIWTTPVLSGLDKARDCDLDVTGVKRLRLVVTDGGDGNRLDAADFANPQLER